MSRQAFADKLSVELERSPHDPVTWSAVDKFEKGRSASAEMVLAYMRLLSLDEFEMEELANKMAGVVSGRIYDHSVPAMERVMIADRLIRAESDGFAKLIRKLISGPSGTRTRAPGPHGQVPLTAIEGNPNPSVKSHQATFNI